MNLSELNAFIAKLERHDWYYAFSDDHGVWMRGMAAEKALIAEAQAAPLLQEAYCAVSSVYFNHDLPVDQRAAVLAEKLAAVRAKVGN
jgi:hypothetical protein